jgi:hypothetical protein
MLLVNSTSSDGRDHRGRGDAGMLQRGLAGHIIAGAVCLREDFVEVVTVVSKEPV